jgi:anti-sigma factor RsiW
MNKPDHTTFREWVNLDVDGALPREHRGRLDEHLAGCAECRAERAELFALEALLNENALALRPGFRDEVLAALPAAGWENRHPRTWPFPAAVAVLLAALAAALLGSVHLGTAAPGLSALLAVGGMFRAAVLAGAGLLHASWKGLGLVVDQMFSSPMSLGVFGVLVLCLNLLLASMLRRRRAAESQGALRRGRVGNRR